jgi:hypothetical protein
MTVSGSPRLADRLRLLRGKYFVGRSAELDAFRAALSDGAAIVHVYGPGGIGKTLLLRAFARIAADEGAHVVSLDGRDFEPSPQGFVRALGASDVESAVAALGDEQRLVVLVDTYEVLAPLDAWLREDLLPRLPAHALIVLGGRNGPSAAWRADPAWSELGRVLPLRNLRPDDSRAYLRTRGVPEREHASVLDFTHGHPLALSLLADLLVNTPAETSFTANSAPDVIRVLLQRFVSHVPSPLHWQALAACAHLRVTTQELLADIVDAEAAPALFDWLCDLPFVERGPHGLFPHDLAREVLDADLRWRDRAAYEALHRRTLESLLAHWHGAHDFAQQQGYFDLIHLIRFTTVGKGFYDWASFGHAYAEIAAPADHPDIVAMVRRHEGDRSARVAEYWLEHQPNAFVAFRSAGRQLVGFTTALLLESVSIEDALADPAMAALRECLTSVGPLRPGERLMHHRYFVGRDDYQDLATHNMVAMVATSRWLTTPRLALSFGAVADRERWRPMFEAIRFRHDPLADFEVDGHQYGVFLHDWRIDPPRVWIQTKVALDPPGPESPPSSAPLVVLSEPDFEAAVRHGLRDLHQPSALATNPLVRSRLAIEHADGAPNAATLAAILREAAEALRAHPRDVKLYRAVAETYLHPAPTQELAAERLGLPFNTYRYQLAQGIKRIAARLWERELHATPA